MGLLSVAFVGVALGKTSKHALSVGEVIVEWPEGGVDYEWDSEHTKAEYEAAGTYIKARNCVTGIKVDPNSTLKQTKLFLSVPRWVVGVPSTLNTITVDLTSPDPVVEPLLKPWPDWESQGMHTETGNCDQLQYVQSMEIDANGLMWVIDVGRLNAFEADKVDNTCPPKLLVFDTATGKQVDEPFIFPSEVVSREYSLLNDIVIDTPGNVAYISDTATDGNGYIYMYNRTSREAFRFRDSSSMDADTAYSWTIDQTFYENPLWKGAPEDGIALSPDFKFLYYSPLTAASFHTVKTADLWNAVQDYTVEDSKLQITGPFNKTSPSDGMTCGCDGTLFYGGVDQASVYAHKRRPGGNGSNVSRTPELLFAHDDKTTQWPDTFAWGADGSLWYSTNHLDRLFGNLNDTGIGSTGPLHLLRVPKGGIVKGSYVYGPCE